ncbi:MAG: hypothetical protein Q8J89_02035 [Caulobacter sp.]|nr:hypothetical protein [Caulobacter sp.]
MSAVILVEVSVISPEGEARVLRFSDRAIRPFPPTDPDRPGAGFEDRLVEPPSLRRALFDDLTTLSPGLGVGAMRLMNADRGLDVYQAWAWGEMKVLRWTEGQPFAAAELVFSGLSGPPAGGISSTRPGRVSASLYDYRAEVEGVLQTVLYAGTNGVGGVLYEGEAEGIKGSPKPIALGRLDDAHVPAPQVNGAVLAHQLHDGPIAGHVQVFDRGDDAGFADAGSLAPAAFDTFSPPPAGWCRDETRGLIKINGDPVGTLTFGLRGDASDGYVETTGPILRRLLLKAGVPAARIGASVASLASTAPVGAWFGQPIDAREAIGWVARSALAAALPDREGVWNAAALAAPAEVADHVIDADEVIDIESDDAAPAPVGEVRIGWGRIWTTFDGNALAAALRGASAETRLAEDYRWAVDEDLITKARHPRTWRTLRLTTALRQEADALALAATLKGLFGLRPDGRARERRRVTVPLTSARLAVPLGATVELSYPPAGIDDRFIFLAEEPLRPRRDLAIWTLWG